jgi:hypothetical protein
MPSGEPKNLLQIPNIPLTMFITEHSRAQYETSQHKHNSGVRFEKLARAPKPLRPSTQPAGVHWTRTEAGSGGKSLPTNEKGLTGGGGKNAPKDPSAASVTDKLQRYTLNPDHPDGRDKARWFKQALGYTRENAEGLAKQLVFDESKAVKTAVTPYGTKFNQTINVVGANGSTIPGKTAWIRGSDGVARLVTAVPGD